MEKTSKAPNRTKTILTIYTNGRSIVQGAYAMCLEAGKNTIAFEGMPSQFQPESLYADAFEGPGVVTMGPINYRAANLTPANQRAKAINKQVTLSYGGPLPKDQEKIKGTLICLNGSTALLQLEGGGVQEVVSVQSVSYDALAEGLSNTAALDMTVEASKAGEYEASLLFATGGLGWHAGYKLIYDADTCRVRWDGSIFLRNTCGASFLDVELTCAAGDVGEMGGGSLESFNESAPRAMMASAAPQRSKSVRQARVEALGNVKLYGVPGKIDLAEGSSPNVQFFVADEVPVKREYRLAAQHNWFRYGSEQEGRFATVLMFVNTEENKLGKPLPGGAVEVLQRDSQGCLRQTGGAHMSDTAVAEEFELGIGEDFDLKAVRRVLKTDRTVPPLAKVEKPAAAEGEDGKAKKEEKKPRKVLYTYRCEIEVTNGKKEDTEVVLAEVLGSDCELLDANGLVEKTDKNFEARVTVPALGKTKLEYVVRRTAMEVVDEEAEAARAEESAAGDEGGSEELEVGGAEIALATSQPEPFGEVLRATPSLAVMRPAVEGDGEGPGGME